MRVLLLISLLLAQQPDTTLVQEKLDSTVFMSERRSSILEIGLDKPTHVNTELLRRVPSITGTPDPIRFVKLLPGVQTGMELDAGLHILGTENSHSLVSVDGVPVYGATHVLGLYSTFISSHFKGIHQNLHHKLHRREVIVVDGHLIALRLLQVHLLPLPYIRLFLCHNLSSHF